MKTFLKILMLLVTVAVVGGLVYFLINENENYKPDNDLTISGDINSNGNSGEKLSGENLLSGDTTDISGEQENEISGEDMSGDFVSGEILSGEVISGEVDSGENTSGDVALDEDESTQMQVDVSGDDTSIENSGDVQ